MEEVTYVTGVGQVLAKTHTRDRCMWKFCVIHSPMPGPWDAWPTQWRTDRRIMERLCPCGVGHPAAEEYLIHGAGALLHGCCGKCQCIPDLGSTGFRGSVLDGECWETPRGIEA